MLDMDAMHNFMTLDCVHKLGVKTIKGTKGMSMLFAQGKDHITLIFYAINVQLKEWRGEVDFIIVLMDVCETMLNLT